jgi:hypothetical protein
VNERPIRKQRLPIVTETSGNPARAPGLLVTGAGWSSLGPNPETTPRTLNSGRAGSPRRHAHRFGQVADVTFLAPTWSTR